MAIQQLTQPIVNPIAAFDATMPQEITFLVIGGAQVVGNRIVISDNQTGDTVYDNKITSMKLAQTIPANTLTNGGYYNVVVYTIDSGSNYSQPSVPVPFYCYSQPNLTISNIPSSETIENGTYSFQGNYSQIEGEALNSYQFILYDSNKNILSQSDIIYYTTDSSLNYTFVGMSNDTSYYVELKGQTVNDTLLTSGLLYFTVRYSQPASFAIVDLVNDCENGFIQISSNVVAIDGKSNPEPPKYIDNKEVDLRDPDSWVKWDEGFDIKDDFTMRVWGRDFNDFEPIITLSNKNDADGQPNRIEMKWMIADVLETLPDYTLVEGKNISIVNGYKTDISDLSIYGNSEQLQEDFGVLITEDFNTIIAENRNNIVSEDFYSSPSPKIPSKIYSSGDKKNQLEDLGTINIDYNQGYFETTDTNFVLKPDFIYNLSFDYTVNNTTTDLYFTVSYKSNGEIFDITNASQYANQTTGRNNIGFMVPANIPAKSTLSIKFARTIIPANVSVTVSNISLTKGKFSADYQSPDIYNVYPTVTQKNIFNYNDIYYIRNENATLTYIQNGFSSEVVTTGEKSFFEFGFPNILQPGNKYAISYNSYGAIKSAKIYIMDKETGETLEQITTENGVFTAPSNLYDIKAEFVLDDSVADNQVQVWNIQLESGEQVTEAETYTSNSTDLTLEQPLRGIGNYRDLACLESPNILNPETQTAIVKGSTTYSLSQSGTTAYKFDYINEDNNVISSESMANGQFTTPDNCVRIKLDTTSDVITANKLQVNLGDTAMVYYPYINEPSVIRYVKQEIFNGTEDWFVVDNSTHSDTIICFQKVVVGGNTVRTSANAEGKIMSNKFENKYILDAYTVECVAGHNVSLNQLNIFISKDRFSGTTAQDFKQYLAAQYNSGKPVIAIYVLNNPTIEPLSSDNISALQNLKTYEGISNVFTNNSMPANINFSYISSQSEQEAKNAYVTLKCWSGHPMPYFVHSNYIDIPKETDKVFIWVRRKNNLFDLKIENLGDYGEDTPIDKGNPTVAITVGETTTTSITITANAIDTVSLKSIKFSKDNGETWEAEIPVDGLSSSATYTFAELQPSTVYQIRAEATNVNDIVGGITQQITTKTN